MSDKVAEVSVVVGSGNPLNKLDNIYQADDVFEKSLVEAVPVSNFTNRLRRDGSRKNAARSKSAALDFSGYKLLDVARPPYNLDHLAKIYETSAPNFAAIRAKTANVVGMGYDLIINDSVRLKLDGKEGRAKASANRRIAKARIDVRKWLEDCCKGSDFIEVLTDVWIDYEATGNGYIEISRKVNGEIGYIGHLPSTTMRVRTLKDGFVQIAGDKMVFFRKFQDKAPDPINDDPRPNEVIHIKKYTPTNGYYGVPDIVAAMTAVAGNHFAERYNLEYFENKAVPRYIIKTKGFTLSDPSQRKVAEFFATNVKGQNHRTVYVPIPADTDDAKRDFAIEAVEASVQDSSFTNYFKVNLQTILMVHRTPITKVSTPESSTLSASKDFSHTFKEEVTKPEQDRLERRLTKIIEEYTDMFEVSLNELDLTDAYEQAKTDDIYIKSDVLTSNEVRVRKGMSELPNGDRTFSERQQEVAEASKTDPTAQQRAENKAQQNQTRERDDRRRRESGVDRMGQARNASGEGRRVD